MTPRTRVCAIVIASFFAAAVSAADPWTPERDSPSGDSNVRVAAHEIVLAQAGGTEGGELEPRYQPAPVEKTSGYNNSYIFGMTRGLAESTVHPAAKGPLFLFTIPLDLAFLPFAIIGGTFG